VAPGFRVRVEDAPPPGDREGTSSGPLRTVRLLVDDGDAEGAIERHGHTPLPPYIHRADRPGDRERYQTVFARETGSVAAPTAGLHFTPDLLDRLRARGVETAEIVLHVGPGTFRPVEVLDVRDHHVDPEPFTIPAEAAAAVNRARGEGRRVVAVGTTATRVLESAPGPEGTLAPGDGETRLVIIPGYRFRVVNALITNFHLPRSSLLLLVAAFAGRTHILAAYAEAVRRRYRFYSYGDATLLL
jgi:S-adenosylmethionine:tRNA ribosyltransferase-isomerase